jgi:hypothetical protein
MAIANVTLNNTYDEWRLATNQLITFVNEIETQQLINAASNSAVLTVSARNIKRNDTLYLTLNVSSDFLDSSNLNVATANVVNTAFLFIKNTDSRLVLVSNDANVVNSVANAAFIQANTARVHANAAFASANAGQASANAGQLQANTARVHANTAHVTANAAFDQANTARVHANTAHASANAGLLQANTARDHANTAHASSNAGLLQANTARVHANAAHAVANAGFDQANTARVHANAGLLQANTARDHANAAFLAANVANTLSVANTLANGMTQVRSTRAVLNFVPTGTIVTFVEDDVAGNRINVSSQVIGIGSIGDTANLGFVHANAGFTQANTARVHANTAHATANAAFAAANGSFASANAGQASANAGFIQANTARVHANVSFEQANTARVHANNSFEKANLAFELASFASGNNANTLISNKAAFDHANSGFDQANTARVHANTAHVSANAGQLQANTARDHANAAFLKANNALANTSGMAFAGNLQIPTGNLTIGDGVTQGIRLFVEDHTPTSNVYPQIKALSGSQFIQLNANTTLGGWNDLMFDRDISIIYSKGLADDSANLVIAPWSDSSFGYKQDGAGRHGFNTSNPRFTIDANGSANISGSLLVGAMNAVPTVQASFGQANTARDHANAAFFAANTGLGLGSAFSQANTARDHANTAHGTANVALARSNTLFITANSGWNTANAAFVHANAAFLKANNALSNTAGITIAESLNVPGTLTANVLTVLASNGGNEGSQINLRGAVDPVGARYDDWTVDLYQNQLRFYTNSTNTNTYFIQNLGTGTINMSIDGHVTASSMNVVPTVQSSFDQANTARVHANTAHASANAGLLQANTARDHANAAFSKANSGATVINTDAISATRYIVFTDKTSGLLANANVATSLSYNPSSGALVATSLKSSALYDSSNRQLLIKDSTGTVVWGN